MMFEGSESTGFPGRATGLHTPASCTCSALKWVLVLLFAGLVLVTVAGR
jgi:hypothetical protein